MIRIAFRGGNRATERGREFWRGVLLAGGFTALPRWTLDPVPGVGEHGATIPGELVAALRRSAHELRVPLSSVLLTAHAKVLGALSGEREVSTGYVVEAGSPLPCRMTIGPRSWRQVLLGIARAELELLSHKDFPVDDLRRELGLTAPLFETVFEVAAGEDGEPADETVLRVRFVERDGLLLRLRYRTDVLDADCAARIAGYHLTALALIAADPDAEHARQSLLCAEELRFQLDGLAGARRKLPERRVRIDGSPEPSPRRNIFQLLEGGLTDPAPAPVDLYVASKRKKMPQRLEIVKVTGLEVRPGARPGTRPTTE